jgi:Protein of unknown function (DUF1549)/Protein of unknown function (DUF1553)/Planctomycete cytochrome C
MKVMTTMPNFPLPAPGPFVLVLAVLLACPGIGAGQQRGALDPKGIEFFENKIRPLLSKYCYECHSTQSKKVRGKLLVDSKQGMLRGGLSGLVIMPGNSAASELIKRVSSTDKDLRMPPRGDRLSKEEIILLSQWIDAGADWKESTNNLAAAATESHWSLKRLVKPPVPAGRFARGSNPVDAFVDAKLAEKGMARSSGADRRTLIRRVTFDLTGLPPTPDEIKSFVENNDPEAYKQLVDRLLASPHYGEHWARHWLDVVHYADTHGHDHDYSRPNSWRYRDYVIRSFNEDKPYARFVAEQVAGDALFPNDPQAIVALGFLAAGPWDHTLLATINQDTVDHLMGRNIDRDDIVSTVMNTFTSMTVHCARCHNHKFDPISQREYYALQAVFAGVDRADRPFDSDLRTHSRRRELLARKNAIIAKDFSKLPSLDSPEITGKIVALAKASSADKVSPAPKAPVRTGRPPAIDKILKVPLDQQTAEQRRELTLYILGAEVENELAALPQQQVVYAVTSASQPSSKPRPIHLLARGEITKPGEVVGPGTLGCVPELSGSLSIENVEDESLRRAALARWLTEERNVLTWRSIVNRVWHYHFGRGLCGTPNDFGAQGSTPSHPELLDWLAVWFRDVAKGSLKTLHRLIVTSETFRQSSQGKDLKNSLRPEVLKDSDNRLLWRMNRTRLTGEMVRDAMLQMSGRLDLKMGGPSATQFKHKGGDTFMPGGGAPAFIDYEHFDPDSPENARRAVYRFIFRTLADPLMDVLDCPDGGAMTPVRSCSTTALQALALLNNAFLIRQCEHIAAQVANKTKQPTDQVGALFHLMFQRSPNERESAAFTTFVRRHGLANACHVLLNSNEFFYID